MEFGFRSAPTLVFYIFTKIKFCKEKNYLHFIASLERAENCSAIYSNQIFFSGTRNMLGLNMNQC